MKNKLTDLNDILFAQLERLSNEDLSADEIAQEIKRASAMVSVADKIVNNARLQLDAVKLIADTGADLRNRLPATLGLPGGEVRP